ncbi:hypothetical protein [Tabrizicola soli]|uniref:DUF2497 domain-containing protein n=1 Tax=Tabrizicola soli TaxID=2185115 RepID=A0ABV7DYC8_9RHOB|nr:hypothetical protein [Tabrizicola soli]
MPGSLTSNGVEDLVSSVRRLVSADRCPHDPEPGEKLLLTPSLRVVPEAAPVAPLILTGSDLAPEEAVLVDADWEEPIWSAPEAPLAEIALGVEEAELVAEAPMWPEVEEEEALQGEGPVVAFPSAAAPAEAEPVAENEDEIDVAEVLTAAVLEDENLRVMDEAELHDLVREILRQELQGSLGERITRNVRKLVRAEVNRALAARSLD